MRRVDAGNDAEEQGPPPAHALELLLRLGLLAVLAVPLSAAWPGDEAHAADLFFRAGSKSWRKPGPISFSRA
jgi:hypothetical protein